MFYFQGWFSGIAEEMRISLSDVKIYRGFGICNSPKEVFIYSSCFYHFALKQKSTPLKRNALNCLLISMHETYH